MATKSINLNFFILDLEGKPTEANAGKVLANILAIQPKGDPLKFMSWALALYNGESINLDPSDMELLKGFIISNDQITNLVKYYILITLNS